MSSSELFHHLFPAFSLFENHTELRKKHVQKDEAIIHHGDGASSLWFVTKGWVKLTRQTPDGKETIVGLCTQGDVFGEAAIFPHANYPYHAESIVADTELLSLPSQAIREWVKKEPSLAGDLMAILNERVAQTQLKLEHMSTMSTAQRLGCFLLRLCHQANGKHTIHIPVEKHLLAAYLGMKPETLSRSQQQLKTVGIHVQGAQVDVENIDQLREFVCSSCSNSGSCEAEEALETGQY